MSWLGMTVYPRSHSEAYIRSMIPAALTPAVGVSRPGDNRIGTAIGCDWRDVLLPGDDLVYVKRRGSSGLGPLARDL
jgi:hypothetical protein